MKKLLEVQEVKVCEIAEQNARELAESCISSGCSMSIDNLMKLLLEGSFFKGWRSFLLEWEGDEVPRGVRVGGWTIFTITLVRDGSGGTVIFDQRAAPKGFWCNIMRFGGETRRHHQIVIQLTTLYED